MATISDAGIFTQIVRFDVEPSKQCELIDAIAGEVERWVRHREGFISSSLHASEDGHHVVNYAQWRNAGSFKAFTEDPEAAALQTAIRRVDESLKPHAIHCHVIRSIERPVHPQDRGA